MLFKICFLSSLLFAAIYPLSFWISAKDPLKNNFHRFHLGLSCLVGGLCAIVYWASPTSIPDIKYSLVVWVVALLLVSAYYWPKVSPNPVALTVVFVIALIAIIKILNSWMPVTPLGVIVTILGGMIFSASLFAMNLGHWYLNVHGLPIKHLQNATYVFWALCGLRMALDVYLLATQNIMLQGEPYNMLQFLTTIEGFLVVLAILFGTIFPLICLFFVKGTLDVRSTQSATGILYAILCAVVIGDITYKYYFFKYGVVL